MPSYKLYTVGFDDKSRPRLDDPDSKDKIEIVHLCSAEKNALINHIGSTKNKKTQSLILVNDEPGNDEFNNYIKSTQQQTSLPIVIMGDAHNDEHIVSTLESGVTDFIDKQMPQKALQKKLCTLATLSAHIAKTEQKLKDSQTVAFNAMADSAEIGHALQFVTSSQECSSFDQLSETIFETYKALDIAGSIRLYPPKENPIYYSDDNEDRPLEVKLFDTYRVEYLNSTEQTSRFITFNNRILTFTDHAALLVRNATEERQGRLRDMLGAITTGLESSTTRIIHQNLDVKRKELLKSLLDSVKDATIAFEHEFESYEEKSVQIIDNFMAQLDIGLSSLSLTGEQEEYFIDLANDSMTQLISRYTDEIALKNILSKIIERLKSLSDIL